MNGAKLKLFVSIFILYFLKKLNTTEIGAKREVNLYGTFLK